ncbi:MAG: AraC family transcriptional regulator [Candidatus Neoclostridium sp.]
MNIFYEDFNTTEHTNFFFIKKAHGATVSYEHYSIILVAEGVVTFRSKHTNTVMREGDVVLLSPHFSHSFARFRGFQHKLLFVAFDTQFASKSLKPFFPGFYNQISSSDKPFFNTLEKDIAANILECARSIFTTPEIRTKLLREKLNNLMAHKMLTSFFEKYALKSDDYPEWLDEFIRKMLQPEYIKLKVTEMAAYSNYSYSHLTKLFKHYTGQTLIEYFKDNKLHLAENLLRLSDYPCKKISECAGYKSVSHFTKAFREKYGVSPGDYRKNLRENASGKVV